MHRITELEAWRDRMMSALDKLSESHQALLLMERDSVNDRRESRAAIERCFKLADNIDGRNKLLDGRVRLIEEALPMLKLTSRWVQAGVLSIVAGTVGVGALLILVLRATFASNP